MRRSSCRLSNRHTAGRLSAQANPETVTRQKGHSNNFFGLSVSTRDFAQVLHTQCSQPLIVIMGWASKQMRQDNEAPPASPPLSFETPSHLLMDTFFIVTAEEDLLSSATGDVASTLLFLEEGEGDEGPEERKEELEAKTLTPDLEMGLPLPLPLPVASDRSL